MAKVTFEYDSFEDREDMKLHMGAREMALAIFHIDDKCRSELKHGEEEIPEHIVKLLDEIRRDCTEFL